LLLPNNISREILYVMSVFSLRSFCVLSNFIWRERVVLESSDVCLHLISFSGEGRLQKIICDFLLSLSSVIAGCLLRIMVHVLCNYVRLICACRS